MLLHTVFLVLIQQYIEFNFATNSSLNSVLITENRIYPPSSLLHGEKSGPLGNLAGLMRHGSPSPQSRKKIWQARIYVHAHRHCSFPITEITPLHLMCYE